VALKKAKEKLITQKQAAEEIGVTERQVRRRLRKLRRNGDRAVIHELRGRASNRKLPAEMEQRAIAVLSDPVYRGFGPTLAAEYLHKRHQITVSKEAPLNVPRVAEAIQKRFRIRRRDFPSGSC
jgi:DNA-binding Lrp family transcriptional regulator